MVTLAISIYALDELQGTWQSSGLGTANLHDVMGVFFLVFQQDPTSTPLSHRSITALACSAMWLLIFRDKRAGYSSLSPPARQSDSARFGCMYLAE